MVSLVGAGLDIAESAEASVEDDAVINALGTAALTVFVEAYRSLQAMAGTACGSHVPVSRATMRHGLTSGEPTAGSVVCGRDS